MPQLEQSTPGGSLHYQVTRLFDDTSAVASAARTANGQSADLSNVAHKGVSLILDITVVSGTPTLDVKLQAKDPISGAYVDIPGAAFAQKTGAGTSMLLVYPGVAETANAEVSTVIPRTWRIAWTIGGGTPSLTFSVGLTYLP